MPRFNIVTDARTLYPGDFATSPDGSERVTVYGIGIYHLFNQAPHYIAVSNAMGTPEPELQAADAETLPKQFPRMDTPPKPGDPVTGYGFAPNAVRPSAEVRHAAEVEAVVDVLLGSAFPLLSQCCVPPLRDPASPLARAAAECCARQTVEPPDERDLPGGRRAGTATDQADFEMSLTDMVAELVKAGHRLDDVLHVHHRGVGGQPLPFPGYTMRQVTNFIAAAWHAEGRARAGHVNDTAAAIGGALGDEDAREAMNEHARQLLNR